MKGETMKHISDFKRVTKNIEKFEKLTDKLEKTNEKLEMLFNSLGNIDEITTSLNEINEKFSKLNDINLDNLKVLLKAEAEIPKNMTFKQLVENFHKRTEQIDQISRTIRDVVKKTNRLERLIESKLNQLSG